ncbi:HGWP repeat containing protein-like [Oryza sativa Japonica Group]|uniref:HGWP repeat containing protein-like n=1 Tax=Oryza sativa subsp. japonica TaxID=39947 RepID=Q5ZDF3_ORYSJ|nr:HGWP repeat containing protein-like [Oryza sativa Japonica Group]
MAAGSSAPVSPSSGRPRSLPTLYKHSPCLPPPFPPLAALSLSAGIELAPSLSLSAVTAELRSAAVVAPDLLPLRRRHLRLHRIPGDLVHPSVSHADRRSTVDPVHPSRAAAFLRSGRRSRRRRRPGVSRGPPIRFPLPSPISAAAPPYLWPPPATIGTRARRLPVAVPAWPPSGAPRGCRVGPGCQPPAPLGAADAWTHGAGRCEPGCTRSTVDPSEDPLFVEVEAGVWESEQGKAHHP